MSNLGKYLFYRTIFKESFSEEEKIYNRIFRLNRESKAHYISDVQRAVENYSADNTIYVWFKKVAHKFSKKKFFAENGDLLPNTEKTTTSFVDKETYDVLLCDVPFGKLFHIEINFEDIFQNFLKNKKNNFTTISCYYYSNITEENGYMFDNSMYYIKEVGEHLESLFGRKAYFADRIKHYHEDNEHLSFKHKCRLYNDFERNAIFYQCTIHGDDKPRITEEENEGNETVYLWFFEDKIIFTGSSGRGSH
jgi:hypothetical protein